MAVARGRIVTARIEEFMAKRIGKAEKALRQEIIDKCRWMNAEGLNQGTSGNISARFGDRLLITPSATPYDAMTPEMIAAMPLDGDYGSFEGPLNPSSEWRFHLDIMRARPEVGAIVHTHSTYATIIAITRREIPACHYMIAAFGGPTIRCAPYARYGTPELSAHAVAALKDRLGCLLSSHGMIALGDNLGKAMWHAVELEALARQYYHSLLIGGPVILTDREIAETAKAMRSSGYGAHRKVEAKAGGRDAAPRRR
jgi:L-fuculose-phosphate aldolase